MYILLPGFDWVAGQKSIPDEADARAEIGAEIEAVAGNFSVVTRIKCHPKNFSIYG